MQDMTDS